MGLQGVEMMLLGYNSPSHVPWHASLDHLTGFPQSSGDAGGRLSERTWVVAWPRPGSRKAQHDRPERIIAPSGEIVAMRQQPTN